MRQPGFCHNAHNQSELRKITKNCLEEFSFHNSPSTSTVSSFVREEEKYFPN